MKKIHLISGKSKRSPLKRATFSDLQKDVVESANGQLINSKYELISLLIPPAVKAFFNELEQEVKELCGKRYEHGTDNQRWGYQQGSIVLGNQKVAIGRPRIRNKKNKREVPLQTYDTFQNPNTFDEAIFQEGIKGVSQRDYERGLPKIAASFGIKKSSISRRWINSTTKQLEQLLNRNLSALDIVAVFIDGKRFSKLGVVIALGISSSGKKYVLGIYESSTESSSACKNLLDDLEKRGLPERDLLFVVDGGSGLNKALEEKYQVSNKYKRKACRVRCYFHKWNNIKDAIPEKVVSDVKAIYWSIRDALTLKDAEKCSASLEAMLAKINKSALASYLEAKDDLLSIHHLQMGKNLKKFFSTTNPIESLNSLIGEDLRRVKYWRDSDHFQRWIATACLQNEKRMKKVRGAMGLPGLVIRLKEYCSNEHEYEDIKSVDLEAIVA